MCSGYLQHIISVGKIKQRNVYKIIALSGQLCHQSLEIDRPSDCITSNLGQLSPIPVHWRVANCHTAL